jgi:hypothetical protein
MSNGANVQDISSSKLGVIKGLDPRGATIYNRVYICSFGGSLVPSNELIPGPDGGDDNDPDVGDLVPGSSSGDLNISEGAIMLDFSFPDLAISTLAQAGLGDLGYYSGYLYQIVVPPFEYHNIVNEDGTHNITTENGLFNIVAEVDTQATVVNKMFAGTDFTRINYLSPLLTDGSIGTLKQYEKIRITYLGDITVTITDDSFNVMQTIRLSSISRDSQWVGIPVTNNRAYGIRISISGVGTVDSIMYTFTP